MLQKQIQSDFLAAYKAKDEVTKNALTELKTQMLNKQKEHGSTELNDEAVLKVINSVIKTNEKSIAAYPAGSKEIDAINAESEVISKYLPASFSDTELLTVLQELAAKNTEGPLPRRIGQTIGAFNKLHAGKAKGEQVKKVLESFMN